MATAVIACDTAVEDKRRSDGGRGWVQGSFPSEPISDVSSPLTGSPAILGQVATQQPIKT